MNQKNIYIKHNPQFSPSLNPHNIRLKIRRSNNCSFYLNNGWLENEMTFGRVKRKLNKIKKIVLLDIKKEKIDDYIAEKTDVIIYTSNVLWHGYNKIKTSLKTLQIERAKRNHGFITRIYNYKY